LEFIRANSRDAALSQYAACRGNRMKVRGLLSMPATIAAGLIATSLATPASAQLFLSAVDVNAATFEAPRPEEPSTVVLKAQILLDRARFSSGVIDAVPSENFTRALAAFQRWNRLAEGPLDEPTWNRLVETSREPALIDYVISAEDVKGPFVADIPSDLEKMSALKRLGYRNARELLAEKFHMDEALLALLNPAQSFEKAGAHITVANVERKSNGQRVTRITVSKAARSLMAFDANGGMIAFYPASVGSDDTPSPPAGVHKVRNAAANPVYYYKPSLQLGRMGASRSLKVARGPNNPVGAMWIGLDRPSYGIHGTPEPEKVGLAFSNGCVRLTNWDAVELAHMVRKGTEVVFLD
jgi:lipoprotein-anchoring transpeptidase ErfK/SrfK